MSGPQPADKEHTSGLGDVEVAPLLVKEDEEESENMLRTNRGNSSPAAAKTCRICMDDESDPVTNPLINPCKCSGTTKYVHRQCLLKWRTMKAGTQAHYRCEICHYRCAYLATQDVNAFSGLRHLRFVKAEMAMNLRLVCLVARSPLRYQFRRLWWARILGHPLTSGIIFAALLVTSSWLLGYVPLFEWLTGAPPGSSVALHLLNGLLLVGLLGALLMLVSLCASGPLPAGACNGCYCDPYCPAVAVAGGEECLALLVILAVSLAVAGLVWVCRTLYGVLYSGLRERMRWAEHMVENVGGDDGGGGGVRGRGGATAAAAGAAGAASSGSLAQSTAAAGPSSSSSSCPAATKPPPEESMV
ncbi:hypothetical protein PLESTB_001469500 [Pleodorina starrii]|uniref:RING-CH-type domain-containing protein n=1 Tax=Pleodorina starrii TaxID=330485 RepID=A0A9W6F7K6_9CHLO|nr:hypothetical protein PLESTB_001469500 [Pleodorina starrii]